MGEGARTTLTHLCRPRLLGEPFAETRLYLFPRSSGTDAGIFQPAADFIEHVEMVLDFLNRAVVRELVEELLNVLFCTVH